MIETNFGSDWSATYISAVMQKVKNLQHNPGSTVVVEKEIFDSLVEIAEAASNLNNSTASFKQIVIDKTSEGYAAVVKMETIPDVTADGTSIVEVLLHSLRQVDRKIMNRIE